MELKLSRRKFLKNSGLAFAALPFSQLYRPDQLIDRGEILEGEELSYDVPTVCTMCSSRCLVVGKVTEGRVVKIDGNPLSPFNGTKVCARAQAAIQLLYDPDRLKYPLKRIGKRGEGKWARISWGEAIDTIAFNIEKTVNRYGPQSMALFAKGPSSHYIRELFNELSVSAVVDSSTEQCTLSRDTAYTLTFGSTPGRPERVDWENAQCILLTGTHLGENIDVPQVHRCVDALGRGAKLIVVDPRCSTIAAKADHHLMIRPGTDTALFLGWIKYIIENELHDSDYVGQYGTGFEELREHVSRFSLERIAAVTDIPEKTIKQTAELMARHAPATAVHPGRHSAWYGNDVQRIRAQAILTGLLGSWGRRGGIYLPGSLGGEKTEAIGAPSTLQATSSTAKRASSVFAETNKGSIRFIGCWGQNPFHAYPNVLQTTTAFKKADFVFACDVLPSEPALYADIVLPEATFLERSDVLEIMTDSDPMALACRFPVITPMFEAKDPYWMVKGLSVRLGKGRGFSYFTVADRLNAQLKDFDLTLERLYQMGGVRTFPAERYLKRHTAFEESSFAAGRDRFGMAVRNNQGSRFPTPSGRIEFYSRQLEAQGFSPLPDFEPPQMPPSGFARLLYGRSPVHTLSSTSNNSWLVHEDPENEIWLNDASARKMGVREKDAFYLLNQDGVRSLKPLRIKITPGIRPDCVYVVHGFGCRSPLLHIAFNRGVSDNYLMSRSIADPISGSRGMRLNFVKLVRADGKIIDFPAADDPFRD